MKLSNKILPRHFAWKVHDHPVSDIILDNFHFCMFYLRIRHIFLVVSIGRLQRFCFQ